MPRRNARVNYWVIDFKDFSFWIILAFVAGAGPNLAGAISTWFLLVLWGIAGCLALVVWLRNRRRSGIGVYVHLPNVADTPVSRASVKAIYKEMSQKHRDWFRSGPDLPNGGVDQRAEWILSTVEHRLDELEIRDGHEPPVFFYVHARNEGAFLLGRKAAEFRIRQQDRTPLIETGTASRFFLELRIRAYSESQRENQIGRIYELDLSAAQQQEPLGTDPTSGITTETFSFDPNSSENLNPRLALIVYADIDNDGKDTFRDRALVAATSGKLTNGYVATEDDRCDHALFVSISSPHEFYDRLESGSAEPFVGSLLNALTKASNKLYGTTEVPVRLFMRGPSILSFAAGALLPPGSRYVPFNASLAPPSTSRQAGNDFNPSLVAIIDGDDVGAETEKYLLSGNLDKAASHSTHVTESINYIVSEIDKIGGIDLISQGGDSAMFSLSTGEIKALEATLDYLRHKTNFKVSCGYGSDSKEAFIALRLAKSSGKNMTCSHNDFRKAVADVP